MIVGWLEDQVGFAGGAELDGQACRAVSPYQVRVMPPGQVGDADVYVVGNCVDYRLSDLPPAGPPVVKIVNDSWMYGDDRVRVALLGRADTVIFRGPLHHERFLYPYDGHVEYLPSPVDLERFRSAPRVPRKQRAVWLANVLSDPRAEGLRAAHKWAKRKGVPLDAYGVNTSGGPVPYDEVPRLLSSYRWYAHSMGRGFEPFGRATVEAWAAGCNLAVSDHVGALYWIHERPGDLENPARRFWQIVDETLERCGSLSLAS